MHEHTSTQAERTLVAIQRLKRCPVCHKEDCFCWDDVFRAVRAYQESRAALCERDGGATEPHEFIQDMRTDGPA